MVSIAGTGVEVMALFTGGCGSKIPSNRPFVYTWLEEGERLDSTTL